MQRTVVTMHTSDAVTARGGDCARVAFALVFAVAVLAADNKAPHSAATRDAPMRFADRQTHRHCHTFRTRHYCHSSGALPVTWPPLSMLPRYSQLSDRGGTEYDRAASLTSFWRKLILVS